MAPAGEQGQGRPFFLPDGEHFLYFRLRHKAAGIYAGSLDAKPEAQDPARLLDSAAGGVYATSPGSKSGYLFFLAKR
jgi:hypothetical protein